MLKGTAISIAPVLSLCSVANRSIQTDKLPLAWKVSNTFQFSKDQVVMNRGIADKFLLLAKCWKESYITIELLPTWNALIHQCKIMQ